nr:histidine kinase dimerization/phosphoacceptor domain -containing protein [Parvularcula maris]
MQQSRFSMLGTVVLVWLGLVVAGSSAHAQNEELPVEQADRLMRMAADASDAGNYSDAAERLTRATELYAAAGMQARREQALSELAGIYATLGQTAKAFDIHLQLVSEADLERPSSAAFKAMTLALITLIETGDYEGARELVGPAARFAPLVDDAFAVPRVLELQGLLAVEQGLFEEAVGFAAASVEAYGEDRRAVFPLLTLAEGHLGLGDIEAASAPLGRAVVLAEEAGYDLGLVQAWFLAAKLALAEGDVDKARSATGRMLASIASFEEKAGADYFDHPAKTADMLLLHAQVHAPLVSKAEAVEAFTSAFDAMELQYDVYRENALAFARVRLDSVRMESDLAVARRRQVEADRRAQRRFRAATFAGFTAFGFAGLSALAFTFWQRSKQQNVVISDALEERKMLLSELHHRSSNNLQIILSLLRTERRRRGGQAGAGSIEQAIRAMGLLQNHLFAKSSDRRIDLVDYLEEVTAYLADIFPEASISFTSRSEPVYIGVNEAASIGLMACELTTNAFKHAFSDERGRIDIVLEEGPSGHTLKVVDNGRGFSAQEPKTSSLGVRLTHDLAEQIGGEALVQSSGAGTAWTISFPG